MPKVSVIIPTYNRARYVSEAIDSVLAQTFSDYEIIVVDDGSTDNTRDVIHAYEMQKVNIRYVTQANSGPGAARNNGLRTAEGDWIAFLDSDDIWHPQKLEYQMACVDTLKVGACFSMHGVFDKTSDIKIELDSEIDVSLFEKLDDLESFASLKKKFTTPGYFFSRSLFPSGNAFDETFEYSGEDHKLLYDIRFKTEMAYINKPLFNIRRSKACPGYAINNHDVKFSLHMYDDLSRAHAQGYLRLEDRTSREACSIRALISSFLMNRSEISCAMGNYRTCRRIALDSLFFYGGGKRTVKAIMLILAPFLLSKRCKRKWC